VRKTALAVSLILASSASYGAEPAKAADPAVAGLRPVYSRVKDIVVRAAEKMPEEHYGFKPTPEVKTFGQFVGHLADAQYLFCGMAMGEKPPAADFEKTKTAKADLVTALKESAAYCDKAFAQGDADLAKPANVFGRESNRFMALGLAIGHGFEHYGNMVTYMRMKGLVPPSSEPPPAKAQDEKKADPAKK
jgi:uncharacterized damage-inducible protein DinB